MRDFSDKSKKENRAERKRISQKDRSKFKKTDWEKRERQAQNSTFEKLSKKGDLKRGRVVLIAPEKITVACEGALHTCTLRGVLKKESKKIKNLLTIGDFILFEAEGENRAIVYVEERTSLLLRQEHLRRRQGQLIAANVDQTLITLSVVNPNLRPSLIDRYIIATFKGHMKPVIVINKIDLLKENSEERDLLKSIVETYQKLGIQILCVSTKTGEGLKELQAAMQGKTSVFSGQSGVGKSSLINALTHSHLLTGEIIKKTNRGMHTTTVASLIPLECGGWCVDTPGIRSFGIWDLKREDLETYFPEITELALHCKFPNCSHTHEPACAVKEAIDSLTLSPLRFLSYLKLLQEI